MVRYTEEQKADALKLVEEIGVQKASEQLHIAVQPLYKWKNGGKQEAKKATPAKAKPAQKPSNTKLPGDMEKLLKETDGERANIAAIYAENEVLKEMNRKLREALKAFLA